MEKKLTCIKFKKKGLVNVAKIKRRVSEYLN